MLEFMLLRVGGCVQGGAVELSCALWSLGVQSWSATCSGGLFGLLCGSLGQQKGGSNEPPIVGCFLSCRRLVAAQAL